MLSGDIRMNQNPQLTVLQIILLREHNRLANALAHLNPHWGDETVFQEARRINIAQYQHINYYEYLPIFLGKLYLYRIISCYPIHSNYYSVGISYVRITKLNSYLKTRLKNAFITKTFLQPK